MASSTAGTFLMYKVTSESPTYTKLCDITSFPDMGSTPTKLDTTDLSAKTMKTSILGLQEAPDLVFEANYDKAVFKTIKALEGKQQDFQLQFGDDGVDGKFSWKGKLTIIPVGGGVDEVRKMSISISAETEITTETE